MRPPKNGDVWYRIDNAGKIFAAISTRRVTTLFRLTATMTAPVQISRLDEALQDVVKRFPYFMAQFRRGFFWYYLEPSVTEPHVQKDDRFPCVQFPYKRQGMLPFRVRAYDRRIAVEFAHALTDGTGGLQFLRSLIAAYLVKCGVLCRDTEDVMLPGQRIDEQEFEDAFGRYYDPAVPMPVKQGRAFHLPHALEPPDVYHVITGTASVQQALQLSRQRGVSIGELLASVYLYAFQLVFEGLTPRQKRRFAAPIRLDVPMNLRLIFPSATMRNFFLPAYPAIDPRLGHYELDEIVQKVHHHMRGETSRKNLLQQIARNVYSERHALGRLVPLALKDPILSAVYGRLGQRRTSSGISNLGRVTMPLEFCPYIERIDLLPPPPTVRKVSCGVVSIGDNLSITFGRTIREPVVETHFFRTLTELGLAVKVESNHRETDHALLSPLSR